MSFRRVLVNVLAILANKVVPWMVGIWFVLTIKDAALAISGENSIADAWVQFTSNIRVSRGFAFLFGACGIVYGLQQRSLRRAEVSELTKKVEKLQSALQNWGNTKSP
jgi:hypothetical protein